MSGPVTLRELSRSLGLSESTVSKALNGRPDVSEDVRNRVLEAARTLGYVPNRTARRLALGTSGMLGVFLLNRFGREAGEYFGFNFLGGIMKEAQARGYDVLVFQESEELSECGCLEYARRRSVEGAVLVGLWPNDALARLDPLDPFPWVSIDTPIPHAPGRLVTTDNRAGIAAVLQAVHARGRRRIGYIGIHGGGFVGVERRAGFEECATRLGVLDPDLVVETAVRTDAGCEAARALLGLSPAPDAIVCATDLQALGALRAARELGVAVPSDLSVTGFDNLASSALSVPSLTTMRQDTDGIGAAALRLLLDADSNGASQAAAPVLVPASIVLRESV